MAYIATVRLSGITAMLKTADIFIIMSESDLARPFIDLSAFTLQNIPLKLMLFVYLFRYLNHFYGIHLLLMFVAHTLIVHLNLS